MLDLASVGLLINIAQKLTGWGTNAQSGDRDQILRFMNGLVLHLRPIASVIRGTSNESLIELCAKLEGYGQIGASQLSVILEQANLTQLEESIRSVAQSIQENEQREWLPEMRRSSLQRLDYTIGKLSGMINFLAEFNPRQEGVKEKLMAWAKRLTFKPAATVATSVLLTGAAKAASYLPGSTGTKATEFFEDLKDRLPDAIDDLAQDIDVADITDVNSP
jgi:hypothetical protein